MKTTLNVKGMTCKHCAASVESSIRTVSGVKEAKADLDSDTVSVEYDETKVLEAALAAAVEEAGFEMA